MNRQLPQLTVGQLRELLGRFPLDAPVELEGCDCYGKCCGAEMDGEEVLLRRRDGAAHVQGDGYEIDEDYFEEVGS